MVKFMYAVIFTAEIRELDDEYSSSAIRLRELAMSHYGCTEFVACAEGNKEIAISYWPSLELIDAWKDHPEHRRAQALGYSKWYRSYEVTVAQVLRQYVGQNPD
jgi:hypothetical protein